MRADRCALAVAGVLALSCFIGPIRNPDLWWHLSAGRSIAARHAVPRADFLSHTRLDGAWVDFEWAPQLLYLAVHHAAGYQGLIALRLLLMTGVLACSLALLSLYGAGLYAQAGLILIEACALYPYGDLRPDNFSQLLFALLLLGLEAWRLGRLKLDARRGAAAGGLLFAVWANLHLGLLYGLLLLGLYAAEAAWRGPRGSAKTSAAALGGALLGCLCNPYGLGLFLVLPEHISYMDTISGIICEWKPARFASWWVWPYAALLAASAGGLAAALHSRRSPPAAISLAWSFFAATSIAHERHMAYFAVFTPPLLYTLVAYREWTAPPQVRVASLTSADALAAFLIVAIWPMHRGPRAPMPARELAAYLDANAPALGGLKLFNNWADGGYLGYKLWPRYLVFYDGRYIFHALLMETQQAAFSVERWKEFMDRHDVELACMTRSPLRPTFDHVKRKQGDDVQLRRPYYVKFMPQQRWAMIYWDEREVIFARRDRVDAVWLRAHEYRALWPDDSPHIAYLSDQGLVSAEALEAEARRHAGESAVAAAEGRGLAAWAMGARARWNEPVPR